MLNNLRSWTSGFGATLCMVLATSGTASAQSGEEWALFGLGIANGLINSAAQQPGGRQERTYQAPMMPNNSQGNMSGNMNFNNNNWFNTPSNSFNNRPQNRPQYRPPNYQTTPRYQQNYYYSDGNYRYQPSGSYTQNPYTQSQSSVVYNTRPAAPPSPTRVYSNQPITIRCPDGETGICSYSLISDGQSYNYTIEPGHAQTFNETQSWQIRFDRGNGRGTQTYQLRGGQSYILDRGPDGSWRMYKAKS